MTIVTGPTGPTYTLVANEIIEEAFDLCGVGSEGEPISADQYARALRSLNLMVKAWGASEHLWLRTEATVALVSSQAAYDLNPKPMRVIEVRRNNLTSDIDTPLDEWARQQYFDMPNKATQSIPVNFYYDPQKTTGTLYVWPEPSAATATQFQLKYTYLRQFDNFSSTSDTADCPDEWQLALTYGLADELSLKYGVSPQIAGRISQRAAVYKAKIESWDTEPASYFLQPEMR
jgi:hypothetical protein